jgi:hypothetical protein
MNVFLYFVGMALIICWALGAFKSSASNVEVNHTEEKQV